MAKKILKQIMFSEEINRRAIGRSMQLGFSVPEYIRYLVVRDTQDIETLEGKIEKEAKESLTDYNSGKYFSIKAGEKALDHFTTSDNKKPSLQSKIQKKD